MFNLDRKRHLFKHWFLYGICLSIFFAFLYPKLGANNGPLKPQWTVKYIGTFLIFFLNGCSIQSEELYRTLLQYRIHLFIQCFSFIFCPILFTVFSKFYRIFTLQYQLALGIKALGSLPSPVSTAAFVVRAIGGNEAIAMFNSTIGSLLGTVMTPMLLFFMLGENLSYGSRSVFQVLVSLLTSILLPLAIGQYSRSRFPLTIHRLVPHSNRINNWILLINIYTTFCQAFQDENASNVTTIDLIILLVTIVIIQLVQIYFLRFLCEFIGLRPSDTIAVVFCGSQKSLTSGMPILQTIYPNTHSMTIPLLLYHPIQILLGNILTSSFQEWLKHAKYQWHHRIGARV